MNEVGELLRGFALSDPAKGAGEHQIGETCHSIHTQVQEKNHFNNRRINITESLQFLSG